MLRKQRSELNAALLNACHNASVMALQRALRVIFTFHVPQHMKQPPPKWLAVPPSVYNSSSVVGVAHSAVRASHLVSPQLPEDVRQCLHDHAGSSDCDVSHEVIQVHYTTVTRGVRREPRHQPL